MKKSIKERALLFLVMCYVVRGVSSHARLVEPPSRSSMWRFGFQAPKNYDDDGLYCGGMDVQHKTNGGKCGVCGDPWHLKPPRPNEIGGKYGQGTIVRSYRTGQVMKAAVDITANHRGYFEFRVCPSRSDNKEVIQECLDKHLLKIIDSSSTKYFVEENGNSRVTLSLQLPKSLTCKRCVFQWTYVAGNNWGKCKNDTYALGCGSQETFKACSDISIGANFKVTTSIPVHTTPTTNYDRKTTAKPADSRWTTTKRSDNRWTKTKRTNNRWTTTKRSYSRRTRRPFVTRPPTTKYPKKFPELRPPPKRGMTFEEALENIRKNPKLKWMLQPKNQHHLREVLSHWI